MHAALKQLKHCYGIQAIQARASELVGRIGAIQARDSELVGRIGASAQAAEAFKQSKQASKQERGSEGARWLEVLELLRRGDETMATMAAMRCVCAVGAAPVVSGVAVRNGGPERLRLGCRGASFFSVGLGAVDLRTEERRRRAGTGLDCRARAESAGAEVDEGRNVGDSSGFYEKAFLAAACSALPLLGGDAANAVGGQLGLLEGRSVALIHPIVMGGLLLYTLYAGFLGWQWRRVRTIQTDISELKKQVKQVPVAAGDRATPPPPPSPVEAQIASLTEERKELLKGGFRDRHFNAGSILLGLGVFESIAGAVNTWVRTGKLFPGPHLFAGAGITICWALAAALVPAMQKGSETARNLHIGLNIVNVALFIWQIPTGLEIVVKVLDLPLP